MRYPVLIFLLLICILVEATSCTSVTSNTGTVDESKADLVGHILEIYRAGPSGTENGQLGAILVEGIVQGGTQDALVTVAITEGTQLWQKDGQVRRPFTVESLTIGQRVLIVFSGPLAESYPMQGTADEIMVTP